MSQIGVEPDRESDDELNQAIPACTRPAPNRASLASATAWLSAANILVAVTALATGPLQARALGVEGRGLLAAIIVPLTFAAQLIPLGLHEFATRLIGRGQPVGVVFGSLAPPIVLTGAIGAVLLVPLSGVLAGGHAVVREFLLIGGLLLPVTALGALLLSVASGLQRWKVVAADLTSGALASAVVVVVLYFAHALTVSTAALAALATGVGSYFCNAALGLSTFRGIRFDLGLHATASRTASEEVSGPSPSC